MHSARFELTTYCSGGNRSIQLSYECLYQVLYNTFEISQTANSLFLKKNLQSRDSPPSVRQVHHPIRKPGGKVLRLELFCSQFKAHSANYINKQILTSEYFTVKLLFNRIAQTTRMYKKQTECLLISQPPVAKSSSGKIYINLAQILQKSKRIHKKNQLTKSWNLELLRSCGILQSPGDEPSCRFRRRNP